MARLARPALFVGIVVIVLGMSKVHAAWIADPPYDYTGSFRFGWSIGYMLLLALAAYGSGLPDLPRSRREALLSSLGAAVVAAAVVGALELLVGDALLPRFVVFGTAVCAVPWYLACVALARGGRVRAAERDRVLLVTSPEGGARVEGELGRAPERQAVVVGVIPPESCLPAGGNHEPLVAEAVSVDATVVVLDRAAIGWDPIVAQAAALHEHGARVRTMSLFYEEWLGKLPVSELERVSLMFDIGEVHRLRYGRVMRMVDLTLASVGLVMLIVLTPLVLLANAVANRGPLLFRQDRVGRNGNVFGILKFRTMKQDADDASEWTTERDPRVTPFGRLLRTTHLDEAPQFINVLRGELSLVGPRPEQPVYVERLRSSLPFYDVRHLVRPGMTGWAQVKHGYAADEQDSLEKLQYDLYYLRHQGIGLDLRVLGRTIRSIFRGEGR